MLCQTQPNWLRNMLCFTNWTRQWESICFSLFPLPMLLVLLKFDTKKLVEWKQDCNEYTNASLTWYILSSQANLGHGAHSISSSHNLSYTVYLPFIWFRTNLLILWSDNTRRLRSPHNAIQTKQYILIELSKDKRQLVHHLFVWSSIS